LLDEICEMPHTDHRRRCVSYPNATLENPVTGSGVFRLWYIVVAVMGYLIGNKLAQGGMGEIHFALHTGLGGFEKLVLIKRLHSELADDETLTKMFLNEASLAAKIRHPNVVETFNVDRDDQGLFIVMGYLPGISLHRALQDAGLGLPISVVTRVAADIASALAAAHNQGDEALRVAIVHRDVTPSNIQLCKTGQAKLLDFGVAQLRSTRNSATSDRVRGTIPYMSPEMLASSNVAASSDVYQLGIVMFEAITGSRPFTGITEAEIAISQQTMPIFDARWPADLAALTTTCLSLDPDQRPTSFELADQLETICRQLHSHTARELAKWVATEYSQALSQQELLERTSVTALRDTVEESNKTQVLGAPSAAAPVNSPDSADSTIATSVVTTLQSPHPQYLDSAAPNVKPSRRLGRAVAVVAAVAAAWWMFGKATATPDALTDNRPPATAKQTPATISKPIEVDLQTTSAPVPAIAIIHIDVPRHADVARLPATKPRVVSAAVNAAVKVIEPKKVGVANVADQVAPPIEIPATTIKADSNQPLSTPSDLRDPWLQK
jgi:eukaryotic-like serine/threonine-protein kinase